MEKELTALLGKVETAKANTVTEFKTSQPFIDSYAIYYGEGFEDCLKQVKSVYPHLRRLMTPPNKSRIQKMMVSSLLNLPWTLPSLL